MLTLPHRASERKMHILKNKLCLYPEAGIGYYPVPSAGRPYDKTYFEKYSHYEHTKLGCALTQFRVSFVKRHYQGQVCDIGIGSGHFIKMHGWSVGYDINVIARHYLEKLGKFVNPYKEIQYALTFWDSLEHIDNMEKIISCAKEWIFVSLPVFKKLDDILTSHHYRKTEHIWYFTEKGLIEFFKTQGFECIDKTNKETLLGRESIKTYAFRRQKIST